MGEVAEQVGRFVNAYSGDLKDETLDGQRVVIGGIVTGIRTVITKRNEAMAIATLEDLQGTLEVVVFPRTYETTRPTWRDGSILLVAGRIDHRGEDVSLLADLVLDWDDAIARGPEAFAAEVAAGDRGPRGRGRGPGGASGGQPGFGGSNGNGHGAAGSRPMVPVGPGVPSATPVAAGGASRAAAPVPFVSPLRQDASAGSTEAAHCRRSPRLSRSPRTRSHRAPMRRSRTTTRSRPSRTRRVPERPRSRRRATSPLDVGNGRVLHVRFIGALDDRLREAMQAFREIIGQRPGETRVLVYIDVAGKDGLPIPLRPVAYDAELLAEIRRRLGEGVVQLDLA